MQTLLWTGIFTVLIVIVITGISYFSMVSFLKERALDTLTGSYNMIFRPDGRLIAHPELMGVIKAKKGQFYIPEFGDDHLVTIWNMVGTTMGKGR
jgi:hypothetical protein